MRLRRARRQGARGALRVAFLTWRDRTHPDGGGSEVYVESVAAELVRRGHEVTVVCATHPGAPRTEVRDGVRLVRRGGRLTVYPRALAWLAAHREVDVVVEVVNGLPFGARLVRPVRGARRRGVVVLVHHAHERQWRMIYPGLAGRLGWFVEHQVSPLLQRGLPHLTVSEASRSDLAAAGVPPHAVTVAHNGVVHRDVAAPRAPRPRLVVLARLVPHKQVEHALDVLAALRGEDPERHGDLHLDVVGDGWWRPRLEAHRDALGVGDAVTLHGHVDDETRDRLLARAWLMLLPSVKEGWGLAVLEAGLQQTPTVAYADAGGVAESVQDGATGVLVEDVDGMRRAVEALLDDADRLDEMGRAAQAHAQRFAWPRTADVVERVLHEAAGPGRRRA